MSTPPNDWDRDERETLSDLDHQFAAIRQRHLLNPRCDLLVAATADLLPAEMQARVMSHLAQSAWSRAIVDGLRQSGADTQLDAATEERILARVRQAQRASWAMTMRRPSLMAGGLALAATVLIAVMVSPGRQTTDPIPVAPSPATSGSPAAVLPPAAPPFQMPVTKPDVKLSTGALTWRGAPSDQPFLQDLAPAFDAYRVADYAQAQSLFGELSAKYPGAIEVLFYQGVTLVLRHDFAGAIAPLSAASRLKNDTFADDVSWFLAVAEQRSGRVAESRSRLSALCDAGGSRAADACAAVTQLDAAAPSAPSRAR